MATATYLVSATHAMTKSTSTVLVVTIARGTRKILCATANALIDTTRSTVATALIIFGIAVAITTTLTIAQTIAEISTV